MADETQQSDVMRDLCGLELGNDIAELKRDVQMQLSSESTESDDNSSESGFSEQDGNKDHNSSPGSSQKSNKAPADCTQENTSYTTVALSPPSLEENSSTQTMLNSLSDNPYVEINNSQTPNVFCSKVSRGDSTRQPNGACNGVVPTAEKDTYRLHSGTKAVLQQDDVIVAVDDGATADVTKM